MSEEFIGMKMALQGKCENGTEFGTLNRVVVAAKGANDTIEKAITRAVEELKKQEQAWATNYDHTMTFRIVRGAEAN